MKPTGTGWAVLGVGAGTMLVARTIQVPQIWMIGTSLLAVVVVALVVVAARPAHLTVYRTLDPAEPTVGDAAQMVVELTADPQRATPSTVLQFDGDQRRIPRLMAGSHHRFELAVPTLRRGVLTLGPMTLHRSDPVDLVRRSQVACEPCEVIISPRMVDLTMARPGVGALGTMLIQRARQFGVGDFEGLRQYVEGDDLRLVHWKASARSTELLVKQFALEGTQRCTVILDTSSTQSDSEFELAVSETTSLVRAAQQADLAVRLATTGGLDLAAGTRPDAIMKALALVQPRSEFVQPQRDTADGLGLVICVTPDQSSDLWRRRDQFADPQLVVVAVTQRGEQAAGIMATTLDEFAVAWNAFAGGGQVS